MRSVTRPGRGRRYDARNNMSIAAIHGSLGGSGGTQLFHKAARGHARAFSCKHLTRNSETHTQGGSEAAMR